ncbi:MAG TPA: hypothetical protein VF168_03210 [Trueperaceae bacterium]
MRPGARARGSGEAGSSLLEMLLACTLLGMLLLAAAQAQLYGRQANEVNEEAGHRGQIAELASELLGYHLGMAGHRGLNELRDLGGPALAITRGAGGASDALTVRYVEERWYEEPTLRALRIDVRRDGEGRWNLYLREEGATRQPAVQQVRGLHLTGVVLADGSVWGADAALPAEVVALQVRLEFTWGESRELTIPLPRETLMVET